MTKTKTPVATAKREVGDPDGEAWHAEASRRWGDAEGLGAALGIPAIEIYDPVPLPDFGAKRSAHVTRELLGRFLLDRDTRIVHDVYQATPECAVDAIRNGTFFHFWSEVVVDPGVDVPCPSCLAATASHPRR